MKSFRILASLMVLTGVISGAYWVSNWSQDIPHVGVSKAIASPANKTIVNIQKIDLGACPFQVDGQCYTCESPEAFSVDGQSDCEKCPNRKAVYTGGAEIESWACALLTCPKSHPINAEQGNCFSCDETRAIDYFPENGDIGANLCPNRVLNDSALVLKKCPSSHPLIDPIGGCYACDETQDVYTTSENCKECSNRSFETMNEVGRCYIK